MRFLLSFALCVGYVSLNSLAFGAENYAFGPAENSYKASKGQLIEDLQDKLALSPAEKTSCGSVRVGYYGPRTTAAVKSFQQQNGLKVTGQAGEDEYAKLGLKFPDAVDRAIQLTSACGFEGTWFTASEGSAGTITDDGVTWGIIGFTSSNGEVQRLLRDFKDQQPTRWNAVTSKFLKSARVDKLNDCIAAKADVSCFGDWGLDTVRQKKKLVKVVKADTKTFLTALGDEAPMRDLQVTQAKSRYWEGVALPLLKRAFKVDSVESLSPQAIALAYDIRVFSNGPSGNVEFDKKTKKRVFYDGLATLDAMPWKTETERLTQIADVTIERLKRYGSPHVSGAQRRWIQSIIENRGADADLVSFGLLPTK